MLIDTPSRDAVDLLLWRYATAGSDEMREAVGREIDRLTGGGAREALADMAGRALEGTKRG